MVWDYIAGTYHPCEGKGGERTRWMPWWRRRTAAARKRTGKGE